MYAPFFIMLALLSDIQAESMLKLTLIWKKVATIRIPIAYWHTYIIIAHTVQRLTLLFLSKASGLPLYFAPTMYRCIRFMNSAMSMGNNSMQKRLMSSARIFSMSKKRIQMQTLTKRIANVRKMFVNCSLYIPTHNLFTKKI